MPRFVEPELARVVDMPAGGSLWVHEIKFDGYRMQLRVEKKRGALLTRKALDWSHRFPEIVGDAARSLPDCIVDGEVAALDPRGISNFGDLQAALSDGQTAALTYFVFDLLFLNGQDFRGLPLTKRKAQLKQLLNERLPRSSRIHYVEHYESSGKEMLEAACRMGLEGVISKRADASYKSGRGNDWTKAKCRGGQEVVIGGWRGDANTLRSLLAGAWRDGTFRYMGRIGTGYNVKTAGELLRKLKPLEIRRPAFGNMQDVPRARDLHWVEPNLVAEVEFGAITAGGILRQASYKGLREDKPAKSVVFEPQPAATEPEGGERTSMPKAPARKPAPKVVVLNRGMVKGSKGLTVRGVTISNPEKALWLATKESPAISKLDLVRFYEMAGPRILPHIAGRPLSIVRAPDGIGGEQFFQRHVVPGLQAYAKPIRIAGEAKPYFSIDSTEGLVALGQVAVVELHPWGAKPGEPEIPERLIFDLDPAPDVAFDDVIAAAKDMRAHLQALGFTPFVKTTGGKGIHVVIAIKGAPKTPLTWTQAKEFARDVCLQMERERPERYTTNMSKKVRGGKIFLDFLRNARTATAVAPWSPRARPGATISLPLPWSKLRAGLDLLQFTIPNAAKLLRAADPWRDLDATAVNLASARKRLDG